MAAHGLLLNNSKIVRDISAEFVHRHAACLLVAALTSSRTKVCTSSKLGLDVVTSSTIASDLQAPCSPAAGGRVPDRPLQPQRGPPPSPVWAACNASPLHAGTASGSCESSFRPRWHGRRRRWRVGTEVDASSHPWAEGGHAGITAASLSCIGRDVAGGNSPRPSLSNGLDLESCCYYSTVPGSIVTVGAQYRTSMTCCVSNRRQNHRQMST